MRSRSSHSRKSPLKHMLSAIWRPEDDAWLDLLAGLDCSFAGFADTTFKIEVSVYLHSLLSKTSRFWTSSPEFMGLRGL